MRLLSFTLVLAILLLAGCGFLNGPRQTLADVEFEHAHFGLEYIPDPSLEGYNETYFVFYQPKGMKERKYLLKPEDGFTLSYYPADASLLKGISVSIIDTVKRTFEKSPPEQLFTTLYVDPKVFDRQAFDCFEKFVKASFQKPDNNNDFLLWMNKPYNLDEKQDTLHFLTTLYAIVYASLSDLEPQYTSPDGKTLLKVSVDKTVYITQASNPNGWLAAGDVRDSVLHYENEYANDVNAFGEFVSKRGTFKQWYTSSTARP